MADDIPRGYKKEKLESLLEFYIKEGYLTKGQWAFVSDLMKDYDDYEKNKKLMGELAAMFDAGQIPEKAQGFVSNMGNWFEETHMFTEAQLEQLIHIREKNRSDIFVEE